MRARRLWTAMMGSSALLVELCVGHSWAAEIVLAPAVTLGSIPVVVGTRAGQNTDRAGDLSLTRSAFDSIPSLRAFAPPTPPALDNPDALPLDDVTGSIAGDGRPAMVAPVDAAVGRSGTPAAAQAATPAVQIPAPDAPVLPVIPAAPTLPAAPPAASAVPPSLGSGDLGPALDAFVAADLARRPGETEAQARQRQKIREAVAAFYAGRGHAPLWIEGNRLSAAARAALARIDRAGEDGLNLTAYAVSGLRDPDVAKLAAAELAISEAVVAYGRQASGSRIDPLQINRLITAKPVIPEPAQILAQVSAAADPDAALRAFNPPQPGYAKLRDKLAELRQQSEPVAKESIPSGPTLKPGMRDARVPLIRSRFGLDLPSAAAEADGLVYDTKVAAAVAEFQRSNGLPVSGLLTPKTIAAFSGGNPTRLENELIATMEEWRWMPRDLGIEHISVNVPDYSLDVVDGDTVIHHARVVVGKPDHQTPIFSDTMRFIIVNPYWNVPLSIIKKEMMPKLADNPNYFAEHGYEVVERDGVTYVRQPPGEDNALGRIKFMFPNQHAVYLHDTNARALFGKERRAFSHGCVRVDQPFKLAEVVLGKDNGWSEARVKKLIGGDERTIMLPKPLPIHITYFTSFVDGTGGLQLRDDLYGYTGKVKLALDLRD